MEESSQGMHAWCGGKKGVWRRYFEFGGVRRHVKEERRSHGELGKEDARGGIGWPGLEVGWRGAVWTSAMLKN